MYSCHPQDAQSLIRLRQFNSFNRVIFTCRVCESLTKSLWTCSLTSSSVCSLCALSFSSNTWLSRAVCFIKKRKSVSELAAFPEGFLCGFWSLSVIGLSITWHYTRCQFALVKGIICLFSASQIRLARLIRFSLFQSFVVSPIGVWKSCDFSLFSWRPSAK